MFDNDDDIFSTRDGAAQGKSIENRMLQSVGGKNTIRTKIIENADGSKTRLRTRGGMPEFVTDEPKKEKPNEVNFELVGEVANPPGTYSQYLENRGVKRIVWKGGAVSTTTIPIDEYIGSDGTEKWKKYRRYKTWTSADKRKVVYYSSAQYNSFNTTYPGGKSWPLYILDKNSPVPFDEDLQRCFGGDTVGHAYVRKEIGGVMQNVVVNTLTDISLSSGEIVATPTSPVLTGRSLAWTGVRSHKYLDATGNKVIYVGYSVPETNIAPNGAPYVVPAKEYGVHVWNKTTGVLTEVWSPNSTGYSFTTNSVKKDDNDNPIAVDVSQSITGDLELCLSADAVGDSVVQTYARVEFQATMTAHVDLRVEENTHYGGEWSGEYRIMRGELQILARTIGGTGWLNQGENMEYTTVSSGALHCPEQLVHAFTITPHKLTPGTKTVTHATELVLCDFRTGLYHSYSFPERTDTPTEPPYNPSMPPGVIFGGYDSSQSYALISQFDPYLVINGASYKQEYPLWNNKNRNDGVAGGFVIYDVSHIGDFRHGNPLTEFGPTPVEGTLCGSLFADDSTIALSVADPWNPTEFYNVIVDRKTKTVKTFDPGCVFYVIYKALKDLP